MTNLKQAHIAIALALSCVFAPAALAQSKKGAATPAPEIKGKVAVMEPVGAANITQGNKRAVRGAISAYISRDGSGYEELDRSFMDKVREELGKQYESDMIDDSTAIEIGKQFGATHVAASEIFNEDGETILTIAIIDARSGKRNTGEDTFPTGNNQNLAERTRLLMSRLLGIPTDEQIKEKKEAEKQPKEKSSEGGGGFGKFMQGLGQGAGAVIALGGGSGGSGRSVKPLAGTVDDTAVRYEVSLVDDGRSVRVRFDAKSVNTRYNYILVTWELDGAANIRGAGEQTTRIKVNTIEDVILSVSNSGQSVNFGRFLVKKVNYAY